MTNPTLLFGLFVAAGAIRTTYAIFAFWLLGDAGLMGPDSASFILVAEKLAAGGSWFEKGSGVPIDMMPVAFWLMSQTVDSVAGGALDAVRSSPLPFVLFQGWVDAGTCILIGFLARTIVPSLQTPATILAVLNPTQIVVAGLFYTDTLFLFFTTGGLFALVLWFSRPTWVRALSIGALLATALMTRPFIQYWLLLLPAILVLCRLVGVFRGDGIKRAIQCAAIAIVIVGASSPLLLRNYEQYGRFTLVPQAGAHLLEWVVPLVRQAADGTMREESIKRTYAKYEKRHPGGTDNPFLQSEWYQQIAIEELRELGFGWVARAWLQGAIINLSAPAVTLAPPVASLPRTTYTDTPGNGLFEKAFNFLRHNNPAYSVLLLAGAALVPVWIAGAVWGVIRIPRLRGPALGCGLLMLLWGGYTLGITGPVVSPKYRLPMESAWIVLLCVGLAQVWLSRFQRLKNLT